MYVSFELVLIAVVASWATVCRAGDATGSGFPYFDNCRRSLSETRFDVRLTSEAVNPVNGSVFCWTVYVKPATACLSPQRRCCSTSFAKVKLYTNQLCNRSFSVMQVTAPLINFNVTASVTQDNVCSAQSITNCVKFTQFGPIPQSGADGTTLCMRMRSAREGGVCHTLQQITNPVLANRSLFELGIYDRKVDNYECCPTFAYNLGKGEESLQIHIVHFGDTSHCIAVVELLPFRWWAYPTLALYLQLINSQPDIAAMVANPAIANVTVFAPLGSSVARAVTALRLRSFTDLLKNTTLVRDLLLYNMLQGVVRASGSNWVVGRQLPTLLLTAPPLTTALRAAAPAQATPGDLGKWVDRDCNAALNLQRAGESKWRPLELCRSPHRGRLPAQGKEYPALGFKKLRDGAPKAQAQQPVAQ
ncbi:hypothetical protein QJQ45_011158 [Haematococcus lacustris]|nr:hypothetical protein QJQ45_011158 [Haematococcus lacustris]